MTKLFTKFQTALNQDRGATAVEYALLVGLIAVVIVVAVSALGGQLTSLFDSIRTSITPSTPPAP